MTAETIREMKRVVIKLNEELHAIGQKGKKRKHNSNRRDAYKKCVKKERRNGKDSVEQKTGYGESEGDAEREGRRRINKENKKMMKTTRNKKISIRKIK